jgi:hypothetical protein
MAKARANPKFYAPALALVNKFPRLKRRLKDVAFSQYSVPSYGALNAVKATFNLTPRSHQIYMDIKVAIEKKIQEGA